MLTKTGRIAAVDGRVVQVRFDRSVACHQCGQGRGCALLSWSVAGKARQSTLVDVTLPETAIPRIGDAVTVSLSSRQLVRMAGLAYLLPLLGMTTGAWLLPNLIQGNQDLLSATGVVLGLAASAFLIMLVRRKQGSLKVLT